MIFILMVTYGKAMALGAPCRGDSQMKTLGMLVGKFELNP